MTTLKWNPIFLIFTVAPQSATSILFLDISACCSLIGPILTLEGVSESTKSAAGVRGAKGRPVGARLNDPALPAGGRLVSPNDIASFSCHAGSMNAGGYDPRRFTAARRALEEHLRQASPEKWRVLDDPEIGFSYMAEALVFSFPSDNEDVFKRMTMAPSLVILKGAARAARYNVKLRCGRKEVLVEAP